jgi:hypothetical protein
MSERKHPWTQGISNTSCKVFAALSVFSICIHSFALGYFLFWEANAIGCWRAQVMEIAAWQLQCLRVTIACAADHQILITLQCTARTVPTIYPTVSRMHTENYCIRFYQVALDSLIDIAAGWLKRKVSCIITYLGPPRDSVAAGGNKHWEHGK